MITDTDSDDDLAPMALILAANHVESDVWGNTSQSEGLKLESIESTGDDVVLKLHDVQEEQGLIVLGYVDDPFPGKRALMRLCRSWTDNVRFHRRPTGWIVFTFENEVECKRVLDGGPYFVVGRPLVMRPMPSCFEFDDEVLKFTAVWIQLPGLPLDCWSASALSKIASKVGTPLCTDKPTRSKRSISFPRILVEVDASKELVRTIRIKLPAVGKSKTRVQTVVFEHEPQFCSFCQVTGHASERCSNKIKVESGLDDFHCSYQSPEYYYLFPELSLNVDTHFHCCRDSQEYDDLFPEVS